MSHAYTAGMPTAQRRRRRVAYLTVAALVLTLIVGGIWYSLDSRKNAPTAAAPPSAAACPEPPAGVTIDVLNATQRAGLASLTADTLRAQRFTVGQAINAPAGTTVKAPAEIRYGKEGAAGAKVLAHRIRGALLVPITRTGTKIDLVLGADFGAVTSPTTAPTC